MSQAATIINLQGERERVTLPTPHFLDGSHNSNAYNNTGTGVWVTALYSGPRTGRKFVRTYSIWLRGNDSGRTVGTTYRELDESDYLRLCERVGCEPDIPAGDV